MSSSKEEPALTAGWNYHFGLLVSKSTKLLFKIRRIKQDFITLKKMDKKLRYYVISIIILAMGLSFLVAWTIASNKIINQCVEKVEELTN